jgi:hypothetical protein
MIEECKNVSNARSVNGMLDYFPLFRPIFIKIGVEYVYENVLSGCEIRENQGSESVTLLHPRK